MAAIESVIAANQCPCRQFINPNSVYEALRSITSTNEVIDWLSGRFAEENVIGLVGQRFSCNSSDRCGNRVNTSFSILNDIRNACREYLEAPNQTALDDSVVTYETSFPSLSVTKDQAAATPNVLIARKNPKAKKHQVDSAPTFQQRKPIRRIRPAVALSPSDMGNIASLQSEEPIARNSLAQSVDSLPLQNSPSTTMLLEQKRDLPVVSQSFSKVSSLGSIASLPSSESSTRAYLSSHSRADPTKVALQSSNTIVPSHAPRENCEPGGAWSQKIPRVATSSSLPSVDLRTAAPRKEESMNNPLSLHHSPMPRNAPMSAPSNGGNGLNESASKAPSSSVPEGSDDIVSKPTSETSPWALQTPVKEVAPAARTETCKTLPLDMIVHLSKLYTTLIISNLVPSTPLELHFLMGLLTIEDSASRMPSTHAIYTILTSPEAIRKFAVQSLTGLRTLLGNLHLQVLSAFIECPPVRELLPDLTVELTDRFRERRENLVGKDVAFVGGMQPILTLPFDENRDSRHKFKTREEGLLYKNREESRDAFLYQLRSFQNIRGRVVDTSELEASLVKIKRSAANVVNGIQTPNMHWFAQFFSDLLLQIGMVPMEETDKELLRITDKDKLQRLHKRFSSKVGTPKGSSIKVLSDMKDNGSPEKEAHQFFPGHQEFFFLFLQAADSYCFGVHLKSRLVANIRSLESHSDLKGVQDRMAKLQLLAKFLGVLLFSPNWHTSAISGVLNSISNDELSIWTKTTELTILPLSELIDEAKSKHHLLCTIPWIVELLRMAKWDVISMRSSTVESIVVKLISLRDVIRKKSTPHLQLVLFSLESFFHQIVGLRRTHAISPSSTVEEIPLGDENAIDMVELEISTTFLCASVSHMDDFLSLLTSISTTKSKSVGTPRKMRPSTVSSSTISFSSLPTNDDAVSPIAGPHQSVQQGSLLGGKGLIIRKLVDLFFHQHGDLKEICEFVADRAVQKAMMDVQHHFLDEHFQKLDQSKFTIDESGTSADVEREAQARALQFFEESLGSTISQAVSMLSMPSKSTKVKEIAATLTLDHAKKSSSVKVTTLVKTELRKFIDAYLRKEKRRQMASRTDSWPGYS